MNIVLVSYASNDKVGVGTTYMMRQQRPQNQCILNQSALALGIKTIEVWDDNRLIRAGYKYRYLQPTIGNGYFSWKPFVILQTVRQYPDDIIIYHDTHQQSRLTTIPNRLIDWCLQHDGKLPGVYLTRWGANSVWTTRDCFYYMNCDHFSYWDASPVQTTFSIWQGKRCISLLEEWRHYCDQPKVCSGFTPNMCGLPNLDGFRQHRWDQSIMSNLCVKYSIPALSIPKFVHSETCKDINLCNTKIE